MRLDKLTTKFQQALADAQSLALANDHGFIEPQHLLVALLQQEDGPRSLLQRAGVNVPPLAAAEEAMPSAAGGGPGAGAGRPRPDVAAQPHRQGGTKRGDQFIASELFLLALAEARATSARMPASNGRAQGASRQRVERRARRQNRPQRRSRRPPRGAQEVHHRPHRARPARQARPGDRPRRGDPPRDPGPAAPHQEQPGADRRARRGQDRHRRGPGAAHRRRRRARRP